MKNIDFSYPGNGDSLFLTKYECQWPEHRFRLPNVLLCGSDDMNFNGHKTKAHPGVNPFARHWRRQPGDACENTHSPETVLPGEFWALWELSKNTRVLWPQLLQSVELFLECVFVMLPGVIGASLLQITHYCLLLLFNWCLNSPLYASMEKHIFDRCDLSLWLYIAWTHENFT